MLIQQGMVLKSMLKHVRSSSWWEPTTTTLCTDSEWKREESWTYFNLTHSPLKKNEKKSHSRCFALRRMTTSCVCLFFLCYSWGCWRCINFLFRQCSRLSIVSTVVLLLLLLLLSLSLYTLDYVVVFNGRHWIIHGSLLFFHEWSTNVCWWRTCKATINLNRSSSACVVECQDEPWLILFRRGTSEVNQKNEHHHQHGHGNERCVN